MTEQTIIREMNKMGFETEKVFGGNNHKMMVSKKKNCNHLKFTIENNEVTEISVVNIGNNDKMENGIQFFETIETASQYL